MPHLKWSGAVRFASIFRFTPPTSRHKQRDPSVNFPHWRNRVGQTHNKVDLIWLLRWVHYPWFAQLMSSSIAFTHISQRVSTLQLQYQTSDETSVRYLSGNACTDKSRIMRKYIYTSYYERNGLSRKKRFSNQSKSNNRKIQQLTYI